MLVHSSVVAIVRTALNSIQHARTMALADMTSLLCLQVVVMNMI